MGKQSQLGPTDPQILYLPIQRPVSALSILTHFERAKNEIKNDPSASGPVWYPILQTLGYGLIEEAFRAIEYTKDLLRQWLARMEKFTQDQIEKIVIFFCEEHESHGKRINKEHLKDLGLNVKDLEEDQKLQDAVLSLYHLFTIAFQSGPVTKMTVSSYGRWWIKNIRLLTPPPLFEAPPAKKE